MKQSIYLTNLERVLQRYKMKLAILKKPDSLTVSGIKFLNGSSLGTETSQFGVFVSSNDMQRKSELLRTGQSFLDTQGELFLNFGSHTLHLQPQKPLARKTKSLPREASESVPPMLLLSPSSMAIVDIVLRLNEQTLASFNSASAFCRAFRLDQPRMSRLMKGIQAQDISNLRQKLRLLPMAWWINALGSADLRRNLTPFYYEAKTFYSLTDDRGSSPREKLVTQAIGINPKKVFSGPAEVAFGPGHLLENDISLWADSAVLTDLKRQMRLIPGQEKNCRRWLIASPRAGLKEDSISSALAGCGHEILFPEVSGNLLRAIWDLSYSGSRARDARQWVLRSLLSDI
jgi:hypothetical protein